MSKRKKICLFVVEGISDKTAMALPLKQFFQDDVSLRFDITYGDITSRPQPRKDSVLAELGDAVREYLKTYKLKSSDLQEIVQLVDIDGCYINDGQVVSAPANFVGALPFYSEHVILADAVAGIRKRNALKQLRLQALYLRKKLQLDKLDIAYSVYYFSCNMDHVLYNERNLATEYKVVKAEAFAEEYSYSKQAFTDFMRARYPQIAHDEKASWKFIQDGEHALQRWSNFLLFLERLQVSAP
ncbi:MAG: hypothetical protein SOZ01_11180 [Selenomonadaceae bacterium]|nr:hypothetical protein [Selenomonadaceae bacterium]